MTRGVYAIRNNENGKMYVGSSINIEKRWGRPGEKLNYRPYRNKKLAEAWDNSATKDFSIILLEEVDDVTKLCEYEQDWLDELNTVDDGYNTARYTDSSTRGRSMSESNRQKLIAANTGKTHTKETRKKLSDIARLRAGKPPFSEEDDIYKNMHKYFKPEEKQECDVTTSTIKSPNKIMFGTLLDSELIEKARTVMQRHTAIPISNAAMIRVLIGLMSDNKINVITEDIVKYSAESFSKGGFARKNAPR